MSILNKVKSVFFLFFGATLSGAVIIMYVLESTSGGIGAMKVGFFIMVLLAYSMILLDDILRKDPSPDFILFLAGIAIPSFPLGAAFLLHVVFYPWRGAMG